MYVLEVLPMIEDCSGNKRISTVRGIVAPLLCHCVPVVPERGG